MLYDRTSRQKDLMTHRLMLLIAAAAVAAAELDDGDCCLALPLPLLQAELPGP